MASLQVSRLGAYLKCNLSVFKSSLKVCIVVVVTVKMFNVGEQIVLGFSDT